MEMGSGALFLTLLAPLLPHSGAALPLPDLRDGLLLLTLAIGCTLIPFALSLVALRNLSAFGAQLVVNLEPVYAILLAIPLLGEQRELGPTFYLGVVILLAAVFADPLLDLRAKRRLPAAQSTEAAQVGLRE
jgi:drug/metabolite transporter (DMT)-like permease